MDQLNDAEYLPKDAYREWKRRIRNATTSVLVFTPYFDGMLVRLLTNSSVAPWDVTVVTDLSPGSGPANYRKKLLASKQLLASGRRVLTLPRLHAKALVTDDSLVTVGSQNFTTFARTSREVTAAPRATASDSNLLGSLKEWLQIAQPVTSDLIDRLIEQLEVEVKAYDEVVGALVLAYQAQVSEWERELAALEAAEKARADAAQAQLLIRGSLRRAVARSGYRSSQGQRTRP